MTTTTSSSRNPGRPAALTDEQVAEAAARHVAGWSLRGLAGHYGVSKDAIGRAITRYRDTTMQTPEEDTMPDTTTDPIEDDAVTVIDLDDEVDEVDEVDQVVDDQPADPDTPTGRLARVRAEAARLEAQVATEQQAAQHRRQAREQEYDRRLLAQYDPSALAARRDALRGELRAAVEAGGLGLAQYAALRATDDLAFEHGRLAAAAADRLRVPRPGGSGGPPPVYTPADLTSQLGVIVAEVAADIVQQERAEEQQRRQADVEGRG